MVLDYQYKYSSKYSSYEAGDKETFLMRLLQRELQTLLDFELTDEVFVELYCAMYECRVTGPIPWCKIYFGTPIHNVLVKFGLELQDRRDSTHRITDFLFPAVKNAKCSVITKNYTAVR